jgi:hypothetical protein
MMDDSYDADRYESYEEVCRRWRDRILGDDWLMLYCLDMMAEEAIEWRGCVPKIPKSVRLCSRGGAES